MFNDEIKTTLKEKMSLKFNVNEKNISDPGTWIEIFSDSIWLQIAKTGPVKPSIEFKYPKDELNRRFPISILSKLLKNGEVIGYIVNLFC